MVPKCKGKDKEGNPCRALATRRVKNEKGFDEFGVKKNSGRRTYRCRVCGFHTRIQ